MSSQHDCKRRLARVTYCHVRGHRACFEYFASSFAFALALLKPCVPFTHHDDVASGSVSFGDIAFRQFTFNGLLWCLVIKPNEAKEVVVSSATLKLIDSSLDTRCVHCFLGSFPSCVMCCSSSSSSVRRPNPTRADSKVPASPGVSSPSLVASSTVLPLSVSGSPVSSNVRVHQPGEDSADIYPIA
jgi:hypothetical protein